MKRRLGSCLLLVATVCAFTACQAPGPGDDDDDGASGTPTATPSPLPNDNSLSFDGVDDFVAGGEELELDNLTALTVEAWVKPTGATGRRAIAGKLSSGTQQSWVLVRGTNGGGAAAIGGPLQDCEATGAAVSLPAGTWTHVALTWDSADLNPTVYVGGVASTTPCETEIAWVLAPYAIGAVFQSGATVAQHWAGGIDELRIWRTKRSAAQILAARDTSLNATPGGDLLVSFRFEEGAGNTASGGSIATGQLGSTSAADSADPAWSTDTPF